MHHLFICVVYFGNKTNNMKKTLLLACTIILLSIISHAQIKKGTVLLGGSVGFSKNENGNDGNENKSKTFSVFPSVGLAIKDNWVIGLSGGYSGTNYEPATPTSEYESDGYSSGIFIRHYKPLGKNFYLYGNAGINYNKSKSRESQIPNYHRTTVTNGVSLAITPGLTYAVSKHFHLEASLNNLLSLSYNKSSEERYSSGSIYNSKSKSFDYGTNFSAAAPLTIGFRFVLGK